MYSFSARNRLTDPNVKEALTRITKFFRERLRLRDCAIDDVLHAFGVLRTNSMSFRDLKAVSLYPIIAIASHSCVPNLDAMPQLGDKFGFKASRYLTSGTESFNEVMLEVIMTKSSSRRIRRGEQLTLKYRSNLDHRLTIRKDLRQQWLFECLCERCHSSSEFDTFVSSPLCSNPCAGQGWFVPNDPLDCVSPWTCTSCGRALTSEQISHLDALAIEKEKQALNSVDMKELENAISNLQQGYHKHYHSILRLKLAFASAVSTNDNESIDNLEKASAYSREVYKVLTHLERGTTKLQDDIKTIITKLIVNLLQAKKRRGIISATDLLSELKEAFKSERKICS